ncbi:hypothetical protein [Wolbachia endosymbiont (group A) of Sphaerophoria taeniata]|uniref:hypothetical protein n=1 Tax=Wolbachia endosymbiont (group A) of Sphaerophoria taeniata TaxID=2954057 RepID=UPI00222765ED|nr:hypothetical protein [Wolbachia endosymbiont (group A) of Sphaerophoria taeniata]
MGIKELVNAFNLNNYACDKISTNFTVEGKKIVGLFAGDTNIGEYLRRMEKEIIGRHYGTREIANEYYNLDCFPFVSGANPDKEDLGNGIVKVKLADSKDPAVIHNLKVHLASEFKRAVRSKVAACLQEVGISEKEAYEWVKETVGTGAIGKPYLYCIAFSNQYLKREYDLETFEFFKQAYIKEFNSRLENCGLKSSNFYEYKDDMLYIKDVSDKVVRSVAEYVKGRIALYLGTPGTEDSKVENFKDVLGDFIFKLTGKSINAYEYDIFTDKKTIEKGNNFVLIPLTKRYSGQLESLKHKDAYKVNIIHKDFVSDIRGKTAKPNVASYESPVYAISNRRIAQLLPEIMQSPIAYNERNGCFEFAVDLENFKRRGSSRFSSTVNSPIHAGPSGLRTPPNQRKADSGYDSSSPPKPKDSVAHSSSSDPRSSFEEIQEPQSCFPRRGVLPHNVGAAEVGAAESGSAGTSARAQQTNPCLSQGTSGNKWQPLQFTEPGFSGLSLKGANESTSIGNSTWYVSLSGSPDLGILGDYPKGTESICGVEPEKQQVSDECSEAKSQESESPKKHGGGLQSTIKSFLSSPSKPKQHDASLKRCDVGRDTMHSSLSAPGDFVTEKPPLSERSASERRAKNNSPSKETSPVHSTIIGSIPGLPSQGTTVVESNSGLKSQKRLDLDQREELRPFLSSEMKEKLDSNSFSPGEEQHLYLTHTPSGKCEITKSFESPEENLMRCVNAQLPSSDNLSSEKVNRDSSFCSIGSASPAVPHKGSVSSELKHPQQVKHMSEALGK